MLKLPAHSASRCATAAIYEGGQLNRILPPITGPGSAPSGFGTLVPVTTHMKMVCAQAGTYSSLHVSVTTTSLHVDGNMEARSSAVSKDIEWTLNAMDQHAAQFNDVRHALGMSGQWKPSGK